MWSYSYHPALKSLDVMSTSGGCEDTEEVEEVDGRERGRGREGCGRGKGRNTRPPPSCCPCALCCVRTFSIHCARAQC